jgi:hypothetical protein
LIFLYFSKICSKNFTFYRNLTRITNNLHE